MLSKLHHALSVTIDRISGVLNSVAAGILAVMMFFTAADVGLRYVFSQPITGSYEITSFMMSLVIAFALAYCAVRKNHINVDVFLLRAPQRVRAWLGCFTDLVGLAFIVLVTWQCVEYVIVQQRANTLATTIPVPHYPFIIGVSLGMAVFLLVMLRDFIDHLRQAVGKSDESS